MNIKYEKTSSTNKYLGKKCLCKSSSVNSKGKFMGKIIKELNAQKIKLNITAVYSAKQTEKFLN